MKIIKTKQRIVVTFFVLFTASLLAVIGINFFQAPSMATQGKFFPTPLALNSYDLYDLGVADINGDNKLDIFTANHSALQSLALNQGENNFLDEFISYGLSQDSNFPKSEAFNKEVPLENPGLYIYRKDRFRWNDSESYYSLVLKSKDIGKESPVTGKIFISSAVKVRKNKNFLIDLQETSKSDNEVQTSVIEFTAARNGELVLETDLTALPTSFQLKNDVSLDSIYIGNSAISPTDHEFKLHWRDRHGTAWADFDQDGDLDVFMTRGGLKGKLEDISSISDPDFFSDELFSATPKAPFKDVAKTSGLDKKNCPGRQASWVDFNQDNKLDLYIVCGRGVPPLGNSPNQLYQQQDDYQFTDVASDLGLDFPEQGTFLWLDINDDNSIDFLWATQEKIKIFSNSNGNFELYQEIPHNTGRIKGFSIYDFDLDGDVDIFAIGSRKSSILMNDGLKLEKVQPSSLNLPNKVATANWVDYDNDGLVDLHVIPNGIYRQLPNHKFEESNLMKNNLRFSKIINANCTWFDANNDGYRDLLVSMRYRPLWLQVLGKLPGLDIPDLRNSKVSLYISKVTNANSWIQMNLLEGDGNSQSIGAKVKVITDSGEQSVNVGHAEGAHFSQGHHRLYVGLGQQEKLSSLQVTWPDGQTDEFKDPAINQLLVLQKISGA
ncbi:MAG: CRTAC1 family protein [Leptolyngbya sp. SIO3F4]|nr:CRTAC1 family protein [Leptolyngbya sp. SIO3F4]